MVCNNCQRAVPVGKRFCPGCGSPVQAAAPAPPPPVLAGTPPGQVANTSPPPRRSSGRLGWWLGGGLLIGLGCLLLVGALLAHLYGGGPREPLDRPAPIVADDPATIRAESDAARKGDLDSLHREYEKVKGR